MKKKLLLAIILFICCLANNSIAQTINISVTQVDTFAIKGLPDQPILKIVINTGTDDDNFALERVVIKSLSEDSTDISGVGLYRTTGNRFSKSDYSDEFEEVTSSKPKLLKDSAVFDNLSFQLQAGDNIFWLTFDLSKSAKAGHSLDASIRAGGITISGISYPTTLQNPLQDVLIRQRYFNDNFETYTGTSFEPNWLVKGDASAAWNCKKGGYDLNPTEAKSGNKNAMSWSAEELGKVSTLVTKKPLNLGLSTKPTLTFYHAQIFRMNSGKFDTLGVYYGYSSDGPFYFIKNYTLPTPDGIWVKREVILPDNMAQNNVYLAFKSTSQNGFGVCVDSVTIYEANSSARIVKSVVCDQPKQSIVPQGSSNNPILRVKIGVAGNTGVLNFSSCTINTQNTSDNDITNVKFYYTTDSSYLSPIQIASGTFSGGQVTFSSLNRKLDSGDNYYWVTYDVKANATPDNILDAKLIVGSLVISDGTSFPAAEVSPTGYRLIKQSIFYDDFETDNGWTFSGDFDRGQPQGKGGISYGFPDPASAFSPSNIIGTDLGLSSNNGDYNSNSRSLAVSPLIQALYFKNTLFSFMQWLNAENKDSAVIEYQYENESNWRTYWESDATIQEGSWSEQQNSTKDIFDRKNFRIRYRLGTTDNNFVYSGWNVDDVFISGDSIKFDAAVVEYLGPFSACGMTSGEQIKVKIKNTGPKPLTNIPVKISIDGGNHWSDETIPGTLAVNNTITYTFSPKNLSKPSAYKVIVKTAYPGDNFSDNDSIAYNVVSVPTYTIPFKDGFETDTTFWLTEGLNSSWAKGLPGGADFPTAFEGQNCLKTNSHSGYCNLYENSYVESPCFNFTNMDVPIVDMHMKYNTTISKVGARMEYSIDGGTNWSYLPKDAYSFNWKWYNDSVRTFHDKTIGWTDKSNDSNNILTWLNGKQVLPSGLANSPSVRFRIHFKVDSIGIGTPEPGFGFDNFKLLNAPYDAGVTSIDNLSSPACQYANPDKLQLTVKNFGIRKIRQNDSIILGIQVNANPLVIDTFKMTSDLNMTGTRQFTMTKPVSMKDPGDYKIKAYVIEKYPNYYNTNNDTFKLDVTVYPNPLTNLPDTIYTAQKDTVILKTITDANYKYSWEYGGSEKSTLSQINVSTTGYGKHHLKVVNSVSLCTTKDSVFVKELIPDIGIESILSPESDCGYKTATSPTIRVHNYGTDTMRINQKIPVMIKLNSDAVIKDTIKLMTKFDPKTSFDVTLSSTTLNLLTPRKDTLKIYTTLSTDNKHTNDTTKLEFEIYGYPTVSLGKDTTVKGILTYELDAGADYKTYAWSDGVTTTQKCTINNSGTYAVTVTDEKGCDASDTIKVHMVIHDLMMQKLVSPITSCTQTATTQIKCQLKNAGTDTIQTSEPLTLSYQVNGGTEQQDIIYPAVMIKPNDSIQHIFNVTADMSVPGTFTFKLKSVCAGDIQPLNDTLTQVVTVFGNPSIDLGESRVIQGLEYNLYPGKFAQYKWQDNSTDSSWLITKTKYQTDYNYSVTVTDEHGCTDQDDVIIALSINDLEVSDLLLPRTICSLSNSESVNVQIKNTGNEILNNKDVELSYSLNGAAEVKENISFSGGVGASLVHTFVLPLDLSNKGDYKFKVKLKMASDLQPLNDTATFLTRVYGIPQVDLGGTKDTLLVKLPYTIQATPGYAEYIWQDNSSGPSYTVTKENYVSDNNKYSVKVYDANTCSVEESVYVIESIYDLGITGINISSTECKSDATNKLDIYIKNNSTVNLTNQDATLSYTLDGGNAVSKSLSVTLAKGASQTLSFAEDVDLAAVGTHNVVASLTYAGDENLADNTVTYPVQVFANPTVTFAGAGDTIKTTSLPISINAGEGFKTYLWADNSTSQYLSVGAEGLYKVSVTDNNNCPGNDSIYVKFETGIKELNDLESVSIYPNPSSDYIYIEIRLTKKQNLTMDMISQEGKVVYTKKLTNMELYNEDIDVSVLPKGMYFVRIYAKDSMVVRKIVVR